MVFLPEVFVPYDERPTLFGGDGFPPGLRSIVEGGGAPFDEPEMGGVARLPRLLGGPWGYGDSPVWYLDMPLHSLLPASEMGLKVPARLFMTHSPWQGGRKELLLDCGRGCGEWS